MQNSSLKNESIVRAYSIPIQADDVILKFIEEYHEMARKVLQKILNTEKFTNKERKQLRDKLLENWKYAAHYVDAALNLRMWGSRPPEWIGGFEAFAIKGL